MGFKAKFAAFAVTAATAATLATAAPASAYSHNSGDTIGYTGRCGWVTCLYYNSYEQGAVASYGPGPHNFQYDTWPNNGAGAGQSVKNNAASAENQSASVATIYYNSNEAGNSDWLNPGTYGQLYYTYNNNASCNC
jgi:hypothetical protein